MHIYDIGYSTCEESFYLQVQHEKKYTKDELIEIISDIIYPLFVQEHKDNVKHKNEYYTEEEREKWKDLDDFKFPFPQFEELICGYNEGFINGLEERGFKEVVFQERVSVFGWVNVGDINSWNSYVDENSSTRKIQRIILDRFEKENK